MAAAIKSLALQLFPRAETEINNNVVRLNLGDGAFICYALRIDEIVRNTSVNGELAGKLKIAFKQYELKIISAQRLEHKVTKFVEKSLLPPPDKKDKKKEDIFSKTDELFRAGVQASQNATMAEILLLFIGKTGTGKSVTINHLGGCKMHKIDKKLLGIKSISDLIIAENPLTKIGHRQASKTSYPQVVIDPHQKWASVDCPGFEDTRGTAFEIYNAFSLIELIERAKSVKGFLFFIECFTLQSARGKGIAVDLKYLQLLLKDFRIHQRAVLFVITKVPLGVKLADIKSVLKESIEELSEDDQQSESLQVFCRQILESKILDDNLGDRVVICDPCGPTSGPDRMKMLQIMREFTHDTQGRLKFGYPISERVESKLTETRNSIIFHVQKTLTALAKELSQYWDEKIKPNDVALTKACLDEIDEWLRVGEGQDLPHFVAGHYENVSKRLTDELKQSLNYWDKTNEVSEKAAVIENLGDHFQVILAELRKIRGEIEKLYHLRMHVIIKASFEAALQTYSVQNTLDDMRRFINPQTLDHLNVPDLLLALRNLATAAPTPLPFEPLIEEILTKDALKCQELKTVIRNNIIKPFQIISANKTITVKSIGDKFALSEILKHIADSLGTNDSISITIDSSKNQQGTFYLNKDLTGDLFKGKVVFIQADQIEIIEDHTIDLSCTWLRGGALTIKGRLKGSSEISEKKFFLRPRNETGPMGMIRCQWPL